LNLDNANTDCEEEERKSLVGSKALAEKNDGEPSSGEDFQFVGDLERGDIEIGCSYILEVALDHGKDGGDGEFPAVR